MSSRKHIEEKLGLQRLDWHQHLYKITGRNAIIDYYGYLGLSEETFANPDIEAKNLDVYALGTQGQKYWIENKTEGEGHKLTPEKAATRGAYGFEWFSWKLGVAPFARASAGSLAHADAVTEIREALRTNLYVGCSPGLLLASLPAGHMVSHINRYHQTFTLFDTKSLQEIMRQKLAEYDLFTGTNEGYFTVGSVIPLSEVESLRPAMIVRQALAL